MDRLVEHHDEYLEWTILVSTATFCRKYWWHNLIMISIFVGHFLSCITSTTNVKYQVQQGRDWLSLFSSMLIVNVEFEMIGKHLSYYFHKHLLTNIFEWVKNLPSRDFDGIFKDKPKTTIHLARKYASLFFA